MAEPITLDLDDEVERCYTCRQDIASLSEPPGINITVLESHNANQKSLIYSFCAPCVLLLDFEHLLTEPRNVTGFEILQESKVIIKPNDDDLSNCLRCLSSLQNNRVHYVSIREGLYDKHCPSLPGNAVYDFTVYICNKCMRWKRRCNRMKEVIGLGYPAFNAMTRIMDIPPAQNAGSSEAVAYPVSMLVNKAKSLVKKFKDGASLPSPPSNIRSNTLYLHCKDKPNSMHFSCDGFELKRITTRNVRIADTDHVIKETICSTSGNEAIKTDFTRRVFNSSQMDGITIVHYTGEILESKKVPREVEIDDEEDSSDVVSLNRSRAASESSTGGRSRIREASVESSTGGRSIAREASVESSLGGRSTPPLPGLRTYSPADLANLSQSLMSSDTESCEDVIDQTCPEVTDISYFTLPKRHASLTTNTGGVLRQQVKLMPLAVYNKVWNGSEWEIFRNTHQDEFSISRIHPSVMKEVNRLVSEVHMHPTAVTEAFSGIKLDDVFSIMDMRDLATRRSILQNQKWLDWRSFSGPLPLPTSSSGFLPNVKYTLVPVNSNINREIEQFLKKSIHEMKQVAVIGNTMTDKQITKAPMSSTNQKQLSTRKKSSTLQNILSGIRRSHIEDSDPDDPDDPDDPVSMRGSNDPDYNPNSDDDLMVEEPADPLAVSSATSLSTANHTIPVMSSVTARKPNVIFSTNSVTNQMQRSRNNSGNLPTIGRVVGGVGGSLAVPMISNVVGNVSTGIPTITNVIGNATQPSISHLPTISNVIGNATGDTPFTITNVQGNVTEKPASPNLSNITRSYVEFEGRRVPVVIDSNGRGEIMKQDGTKIVVQRKQPSNPVIIRRPPNQTLQMLPRAPLPIHRLPGSSSMQTITMVPRSIVSQSAIGPSLQNNKTVMVRTANGGFIRLNPGNVQPGNRILPIATSQNSDHPESQATRYRCMLPSSMEGARINRVQGGPNGQMKVVQSNGQIIVQNALPAGRQILQIPPKKTLVMVNPNGSIQPKVVTPEPNIKSEPADPLEPQIPQLSPVAAQEDSHIPNLPLADPKRTKLKRVPVFQEAVFKELAEECMFHKTYTDVLIFGSDPTRPPVQTHSIVLACISDNLKKILHMAERNSEGIYELVAPEVDLVELDMFLDEVVGGFMKTDVVNFNYDIKPSLWGFFAGFDVPEKAELYGKVWHKDVKCSTSEKSTNDKSVSSSLEESKRALKRNTNDKITEEADEDSKPPKTIKLASFCKLTAVDDAQNIAEGISKLQKSLRETLFEDSSDNLFEDSFDNNDQDNDAEMVEDLEEGPIMVAPVFEESLAEKYSNFTDRSYNIKKDSLPIIPVTVNVENVGMPLNMDIKIETSISPTTKVPEAPCDTEENNVSFSLNQDIEDLDADLAREIEMNDIALRDTDPMNDSSNHFNDELDLNDFEDLETDVPGESVIQNGNSDNDDLDLQLERLDQMLADDFDDIPSLQVNPIATSLKK